MILVIQGSQRNILPAWQDEWGKPSPPLNDEHGWIPPLPWETTALSALQLLAQSAGEESSLPFTMGTPLEDEVSWPLLGLQQPENQHRFIYVDDELPTEPSIFDDSESWILAGRRAEEYQRLLSIILNDELPPEPSIFDDSEGWILAGRRAEEYQRLLHIILDDELPLSLGSDEDLAWPLPLGGPLWRVRLPDWNPSAIVWGEDEYPTPFFLEERGWLPPGQYPDIRHPFVWLHMAGDIDTYPTPPVFSGASTFFPVL